MLETTYPEPSSCCSEFVFFPFSVNVPTAGIFSREWLRRNNRFGWCQKLSWTLLLEMEKWWGTHPPFSNSFKEILVTLDPNYVTSAHAHGAIIMADFFCGSRLFVLLLRSCIPLEAVVAIVCFTSRCTESFIMYVFKFCFQINTAEAFWFEFFIALYKYINLSPFPNMQFCSTMSSDWLISRVALLIALVCSLFHGSSAQNHALLVFVEPATIEEWRSELLSMVGFSVFCFGLKTIHVFDVGH